MARSRLARKFLHGRRAIIESYQAYWHGRGALQEKLCFRVDRYRRRCEITAQVLEQDEYGDWFPARTLVRLLTAVEWEQVAAWVEEGFWRQSSRDTAMAVMDGDCWCIEGYRDGNYHEVYRHSGSVEDGSGSEVYELGKRLAALAGSCRFKDPNDASESGLD